MRYIPTLIVVVLISVFVTNLPKMLDYENNEVEAFKEDHTESQDMLPIENGAEKYEGLRSIENYSMTSGNLGSNDMSFSQPDMLSEEKLEEDDNKKIYFFGRIDPVTDAPDGEVESNGWGEWSEEFDWQEQTVNQNTPYPDEEEVKPDLMEPIEVTLDRFLERDTK